MFPQNPISQPAIDAADKILKYHGAETTPKALAEIIQKAIDDNLFNRFQTLELENKKFRSAIEWALGINGEFRQRINGEEQHYWRTELRKRAGL